MENGKKINFILTSNLGTEILKTCVQKSGQSDNVFKIACIRVFLCFLADGLPVEVEVK